VHYLTALTSSGPDFVEDVVFTLFKAEDFDFFFQLFFMVFFAME